MKLVTTHEAKTHLSRLLKEVENGEEIIICRGDRKAAKLVPYEAASRRRPKVGTVTSLAIDVREGALAPLDRGDLDEWGI